MTAMCWAYKRPYCSPPSGNVMAETAKEAFRLIHFMHGYASGTRVFCARTDEEWVDDYRGVRRVKESGKE